MYFNFFYKYLLITKYLVRKDDTICYRNVYIPIFRCLHGPFFKNILIKLVNNQ